MNHSRSLLAPTEPSMHRRFLQPPAREDEQQDEAKLPGTPDRIASLRETPPATVERATSRRAGSTSTRRPARTVFGYENAYSRELPVAVTLVRSYEAVSAAPVGPESPEHDPLAVYLARLGAVSRRTMRAGFEAGASGAGDSL
jgi:hypothetical protein